MFRHLPVVATICIFSSLPVDAAAQSKQASPVRPTTRLGVYTAQQADRGASVYGLYCKSCHTAETHTGATFASHWNGKQLSDLYSYVRDRMPKNDPGSLSEQEYADVTAYVLKMNRMPIGKSDLPADSAKLSLIRIVTTKASSQREK